MADGLEEARSRGARTPRFPWLALILLAASIYVFWVLPRQFPVRQVEVEFEGPVKTGGERAEGKVE